MDKSILMKMYFLVDELEATLTTINPIRSFKDTQDIVVFQSLLSKCISTRKHLNTKYQNDKVMEEFDNLSDQLTEAFKRAYK